MTRSKVIAFSMMAVYVVCVLGFLGPWPAGIAIGASFLLMAGWFGRVYPQSASACIGGIAGLLVLAYDSSNPPWYAIIGVPVAFAVAAYKAAGALGFKDSRV